MSVKSLIKLYESENIAEDLDDSELTKIADGVRTRADQDYASMKDWMDAVDEGLRLCKPEFAGKSEPWEGAANFKSTLLAEAANDFGNRATLELMRDPKLVKAEIIGASTIKNVIEKKSSEIAKLKKELDGIQAQVQQLQEAGGQLDPEQQQLLESKQKEVADKTAQIQAKRDELRNKAQRADRVTEALNWAVNVDMPEWREEHEQMLYRIPLPGCMFKKSFYDKSLGRCVSDVIGYPDFIVNQSTKRMETCRSFTHIISIDKATASARMKTGAWKDVDLYSENDSGDQGSDEAHGSKETRDNPDKFYEQYCWLDLDDDGYEEPYIVTMHYGSSKIVRIVARFDTDSIIVKVVPNDKLPGISKESKTMSLAAAQRKRAELIIKDAEEFQIEPNIPDAEDFTGLELVRIEATPIITKYGFMPSIDGTFLDIGFFYLIGSLTGGVNKTTNDLLNSGTLANQQGGITAKGFRKKAGPFKIKHGEFVGTEIPAEQLMSSILPLPFKEPSATLFQLNEKMDNAGRSFAANADAGGQIQSNTAPTTALAMVQESMVDHTAHISYIIKSMSKEFKILSSLFKQYFDQDDYVKITGDDEADVVVDFATDGMDIVCGANPEMSSKMQRMMLAQAEMEQVPMVIQAGGNPVPIIKNWYRRIGSENVEEIFPNEAELSPEEKAQMEAMRQQQEMANKLAEQQLQLTQLQTELLKRGEDRKDFESQVTAKETLAKIDKIFEEMKNLRSQTTLNYEKAETEQVKNQIDVYTAVSDQMNRIEDREDSLAKEETGE